MTAKIIKLAEECQEKAYNLNFTNPDDDYCWWALHETASLFVHFMLEDDQEGYTKLGKELLEMVEETQLFDELKQELTVVLAHPSKCIHNKNGKYA